MNQPAILMGLFLLLLSGCAASQPRLEADIRSILAAQDEAWNRGDIDGFMQHYWKSDELTFSSGGQTQHGWQATLDRYRKRYPTREQMGRLSFELERVDALGPDAALVLGRWRLERENPVGGNFSLVLRRIGGRWLIVHDHTSVAP